MTKSRLLVFLAVSLASAILASMAFSAPVAASTQGITLFGSRAGWGTNATNAKSPGPVLSATDGDTIVLTVNSTDARTHTWYLDYSNDSVWNTTREPGTTFPNATGFAVTITFVLNHTGTFHYRSVGNPDAAMWGNFTIAPVGGLLGGGGNTVLIVVGVIIVIVAVLAVSAMFWQRMKGPKTPPPKR